jgi:cytochrome P450
MQETLDDRLTALFAGDVDAMWHAQHTLRELRGLSPVYRLGDTTLVSRYADVKHVLHDATFTNYAYAEGTRQEAFRAQLPDEQRAQLDDVLRFEALYLSRNEGAEHDRLRTIAGRAFVPKRVAALGDAAQQYIDALLEDLGGSDVVDLLPLCNRVPLMIISDLLGIPKGDRERIRSLTNTLALNIATANPDAVTTAHEAHLELQSYVERMIQDHRASRPSELVATMMDAESGHRLSAEELTAMFIMLMFGGHESTTNLISHGVAQLLGQREQWDLLCEDPNALAAPAVEELIRYVSPAQWLPKLPTADSEIAGERVEARQTVLILVAAANRDPEVFEDPEKLDITRPDAKSHIGFGGGQHFCIGAALARLECKTVLHALATRCPHMELAGDDLEYCGNPMVRKLKALPVNLHFSGSPAAIA